MKQLVKTLRFGEKRRPAGEAVVARHHALTSTAAMPQSVAFTKYRDQIPRQKDRAARSLRSAFDNTRASRSIALLRVGHFSKKSSEFALVSTGAPLCRATHCDAARTLRRPPEFIGRGAGRQRNWTTDAAAGRLRLVGRTRVKGLVASSLLRFGLCLG